jgi:diguanylate cyclase (GGDEF)-like protein
MAFCDPLTGLSNRNHLQERLQQAMRRDARTSQYGALLFIDLDDFKHVNDQAGHLTGDFILVKAARRLEANVRKYDTVARWGGDEFVVLIEELGERHEEAMLSARMVADQLLRVLQRPYVCKQGSYSCPPSIGLVCFRNGAAFTDIVLQADRAMYQAKQAGKGRVYADRSELLQESSQQISSWRCCFRSQPERPGHVSALPRNNASQIPAQMRLVRTTK